MADQLTRRETLKRGLVAASLLALAPEWTLPALAQGDADVPFTDIPATFHRGEPVSRHPEDRRPHHAERPVLLHSALQQARNRSGRVPSEAHGAG